MSRKTFTVACGAVAAFLTAVGLGLVGLDVRLAGLVGATAGGFAAMYAFLLKTDTPEATG